MALRLAEIANGVVINADASQIYADLRIVSARPTPEDEARAPHRLFGVRDGAMPCSAADWAALARAAIDEAHVAGRLPIVVGGTGLYLRTLIDGIAPVPAINPAIREAVRAMPVAEAQAALVGEDPEAAARLRPADGARIARALEVVRSTGRPLADWQQERSGGIGHRIALVAQLLLPPRDWLAARCAARFRAMLDAGALGEVQALMARALDPALPVMRAIGVPEIVAHLAGQIDRDMMIERGTIATRRYAKRQYTWFRGQSPPSWLAQEEQLDDASTAYLATKLRERCLTR